MADEYHWLSEAVVDFLRGPLYINPLMAFIDERCLIFTTEEENKLEYTTIHNDFKELVDNLLTSFLEELGITPEAFFEIMSANQGSDKLSDFVVRTILTVDDFLMFKAMMVKRNIDLTNQVLAAMEEVREAAEKAMGGGGEKLSEEEEAKMMEAAIELSKTASQSQEQMQKLIDVMRRLQIEDEDPAMLIAIANSLKTSSAVDAELAELEQAIALSLALEEEKKKAIGSSNEGSAVKSDVASLANIPPLNPTASKAVASEFAASAKKADTETDPKPSKSDVVGGADENMMMGGKLPSMKGTSAFKDKASKEALESHKAQLMASKEGGGKGDVAAQQWMMDAKKKLVASKKLERQAEMDDYKAGKGRLIDTGALVPNKKPSEDDLEAKRAALREKLAAKFRQEMLEKQG